MIDRSRLLLAGSGAVGVGVAISQAVGGIVAAVAGPGPATDRALAGLLVAVAIVVLIGWAFVLVLVRRIEERRPPGAAGRIGPRFALGASWFAVLPTWVTLGSAAAAVAVVSAIVVGVATTAGFRRLPGHHR